jgi:trans-aconitate methyltransferase
LVDFLLDEGYENITILDISSKAVERAKKRLGQKGENVNWIISDILKFEPETKYDIWHDRATFHFLTTPIQIKRYIEITEKWVANSLIIRSFSENRPTKCSGLEIKQYSEMEMENQFSNRFQKIRCVKEDQINPFETTQNFTFCVFKKIT